MNLKPVIPGWNWVEEHAGMQMYRDAEGDALSLARVEGAIELSDEDERHRYCRQIAESRGAGLVEVRNVETDDGPALFFIYKRLEKPAFVFTGMLMVPSGEYTNVWTMVATERGTTGVREAIITTKLFEAGELTKEDYKKSWAQDPYDPDYSGVDKSTLRYLSDAPEYDGRVSTPSAFQSQARATKTARRTMRLKLPE